MSPNLMVKDVQQTVDFYQQILGFTLLTSVVSEFDKSALQWALLQAGDVTIMFQEEQNIKQEYTALESQAVGGSFTLYLTVTDVKQFYQKVKNLVPILKELHQTFYGATEFAIKDTNGYILTLAEQQS